MKLYIESALRIKARIILSGLLILAISFGILYMAKAGDYTSAATVWVEKPLYIDASNLNTNPYIDAATSQGNILRELLTTRQFTLDIARAAKIPMPSPASEEATVNAIQRAIYVEAVGAHLLRVSCTGSKNNYCKEIITQTISQFIGALNTDHERQAEVALQLYEEQRTEYEQQMIKSRNAYNRYLLDHPAADGSEPLLDPAFVELQQQYLADKARYDEIVMKIDSIRTQSLATSEATNSFFRVIDSAQEAEPYLFSMKDLLRNGLVAGVLALLVVVGVTLVSTWADPTVHTLNDINALVQMEDAAPPELLIAIVPYNKGLAALRKRSEQENKAQAKSTAKSKSPGTGKLGADFDKGPETSSLGSRSGQSTGGLPVATGPLPTSAEVVGSARARQ